MINATIRKISRYPQLLPLLVFLAMLAVSWHRWTNVIVDIGRESDLPRRLLFGELLYRDVHYTYLPFTPYFNALLYRIFGVHLDTLAFSGIFFSALLAFVCYRLAVRLMPTFESAVAISLVILICFFKPSGNSILPYSFATLHGGVFGALTALSMIRYAESGLRRELLAAGAWAGLTALTKQEFAFASAAVIVLSLVYIHRKRISAIARDLAVVAVPALALTVPVYAWFFATIDARTLVYDCHIFLNNVPESLVIYNNWRSGLGDPVASLIQMTGAAAILVAIAAGIFLIGDRNGVSRRGALLVAAISAGFAALVLVLEFRGWDGSPVRALPFLLAAALVWQWISGKWKDPSEDREGAALFIASAYGLAALARVILRVPSGGFSGGSYLPVALIVLCFFLMSFVPSIVIRMTGDEASRRRSNRVAIAFCIVPVISLAVAFGLRYERRFTYRIDTPRGTVYAEEDTGPVVSEALKFIKSNTKPNEVIAVVPEGNALAFLTGRRIDLRHQVLIPNFMSREDELAAIRTMEHDSVRFVFVVNRPMREFGKTAFGTDFYTTLGGWIEEDFRLVKVFGAEPGADSKIGDPRFFIKVYERRAAPEDRH